MVTDLDPIAAGCEPECRIHMENAQSMREGVEVEKHVGLLRYRRP